MAAPHRAVTPGVSTDHTRLGGALLLMICGDVIRPGVLWLYNSPIRDLTGDGPHQGPGHLRGPAPAVR
jgi:hypothetical protein